MADSQAQASDVANAITFSRVFALALPIIVSNLSVPLVGLVDTAVMGRLDDPAFVGAVALGAVTFSSLFWAFGFLRMGTTGLIAQEYGRGDGTSMRLLLRNSAVLAGLFALLVLASQSLVAVAAVHFMGAADDVSTLLTRYIEVRIWSAPAVLFNYLLMGALIGLQRTGFALVAQLALNLTNAGLSILFVMGWQWDVFGVALASVISEYFAALVGAVLLARVLGAFAGRWSLTGLASWSAYRRLISVNGDIFLRTLCLLFAMAWFARQGTSLGAIVLAANAILLQFVYLLSYGLDGFAHAAEGMVGQAAGARDRHAYRLAIRLSTAWAVLTACVYVVGYALFGIDLIASLTTLEPVREAAARYLPWLIAMPLLAVWSYQLDGIAIGLLKTREMRNAMMVSIGLFVPLSLLLMHGWGNHGLWLAMAVMYCLRAVTLGGYILKHEPWPSADH